MKCFKDFDCHNWSYKKQWKVSKLGIGDITTNKSINVCISLKKTKLMNDIFEKNFEVFPYWRSCQTQ